MSEIQSVTDPIFLKWVFGSLIGLVNILIIFISRNFKKDFEKLRDRSDKDHDILKEMNAEHQIYHPKHSAEGQ